MKNILIIDDDVDIIEYYKNFLSNTNYRIRFAKNTVEAYRILDHHIIDLIVCDYHLQEETGLEFVRGLKRYYRTIPCIMISNFKLDMNILEALHSKTIELFLMKPVRPLEMNKLIDSIVLPA